MSRPIRSALLPALALALALAACESFDDPRGPDWPRVERETALDGTLCFRCGDLYLAEEPRPRTLETLERRGLEVVLDLRDPTVGLDDPTRSTARRLDLDYVPLPTESEGYPTDAQVDAFLAELARAEGRILLVFCERASTSALLFAIHRAVAVGVETEAAIEEGLRIGMKSGPSEDFVRRQVARLTGEPPAGPAADGPAATPAPAGD